MTEEQLTQKLFDEIVEMEKLEKQWLSPKSTIKTTKKLATEGKDKYNLNDKSFIIQRNIKLDLILWIAITILILVPMAYAIVNDYVSNNSNIAGVLFFSIFLFLFIFIGYKNLTLKSLTSPIIFTTKELIINNETFFWSEIQETFYVIRFPGKTGTTAFVLGLKNGVTRFFDIGNQLGFKYSERDFSKLVEHYKHFTSHNRRFGNMVAGRC